MDEFVTRDEYDQTCSTVQRAMASITVFKTQIKIFEKKFMTDRAFDASTIDSTNLIGKADKVFAMPGSDSSKMSLSIVAAANMKKKLQSNINRIDLLTDSKIGDVKGLLKSLTDSIL